ncbi:preprotein translocase subunit SecE [Oenococcus alcoholitolerans]
MIRYFRNTIDEMKRVTWLNADQTSRDTMSVILTSVFFSAFLTFVGWIFSMLIRFLING